LDIRIIEDENNIFSPSNFREIIFEPKEYKNFSIEWSTALSHESIDIDYGPTDPDILRTDRNSGKINLKIGYNAEEDNNQTPGFETSYIIFIFVIMALINFLKKKLNP
jgi:hypothetical protein